MAEATALGWRGVRATVVAVVAAVVAMACLTGCSDRPKSFQTACDHVAAANDAAAAGDMTKAEDELKAAYDQAEPVHEDATGTKDATAVDSFYGSVNIAHDHFGTKDGLAALADAERACA